MMDWDKLRVFHAVAMAQSFTKAGETLNLSQSAISRQISALEDDLQVSLFHRHARGLLLSEQGEILFQTVGEILGKLSAAENALLETKERPKGPLKITAPVGFGNTWVTAHLPEFCELYPDILVTLMVDDKELDLTMREADVALRLFPARHPDLVQKHLTTLNVSAYASNGYLGKHGVPRKPEDLAKHRLIVYPEDMRLPYGEVNWLQQTGVRPGKKHKAHFKVNSLVGMARAVTSGMGIAALPEYLAKELQGITKVLPEVKGPGVDVYFIYPFELRNSKRINVLRDFLLRKLIHDGMAKPVKGAA